MQPGEAEPSTTPETPAPVTPEITPEAPKKRSNRKLITIIVAVIVVVAVLAVVALVYLSAGSIRVNTTSTFLAATQSATFTASIQTPALTSAGGNVNWNFGDGSPAVGAGTNTSHVYTYPGTFFVYAASTLSNGRTADNSMALFPMQVGPAPVINVNPLGEIRSLGILTINKTASSAGAPLIAPGGSVAFVAAPQILPTFEYDTNTTVGWTPTTTAQWTNFTWEVKSLTISFGDGSANATNAGADTFKTTHTYSTAGLYTAALTVTTQNMSSVTNCPNLNCTGASPTTSATASSACGNQCTATTVVGQTIGVGSYALVTYSGNVVNPGVIINDEAVTGAYTSLDPGVDYESTGYEIIENVYQTLLAYNGSSSDTFVPVIASDLPTFTPDFMNYTFHIRTNLKFSNGDPVMPYDVKYSITRTMLFVAGSPSTPGWIISQYLLPVNPDGTYNNNFTNVDSAITVDNTANTVTFHLQAPAPQLLFEQIVSDQLGCGVVDHLWLEAVGPKLTWTPKGFLDYSNYSLIQNYVGAWRNGAVGSGPYMIDYVSPPDSVVLKSNPYYTPVGSVYPAPTVKKIVLNYVADDSTRELSLQAGTADLTANFPPARFNVALGLQSQGLVNIQFAPALNMGWWWFNYNILNANNGQNRYGNNLPADFFVDLNIRKAFFYAMDYTQYIDQILGNKKYNADFGDTFNGLLPNGMPGYQNLSYFNRFDMQLARFYYNQSYWVKTNGWANFGFKLAINVETADSVNKAEAAAWAANIMSLGPPGKIQVSVVPISFEEQIEDSVPGANPMALYELGWLPDYPYPTDYTIPMGEPGTAQSPYGGTYPAANYFNISYFATDSHALDTPNGFAFKQSDNMTRVLNYFVDSVTPPSGGGNSTNFNAVIRDSQLGQLELVNLTWAVPEFQSHPIYVYRTWLTGMSLEQSVMYNAGVDIMYQWLGKPSSVTTAGLTPMAVNALPVIGLAFASPMATIALVGIGAWPRRHCGKES